MRSRALARSTILVWFLPRSWLLVHHNGHAPHFHHRNIIDIYFSKCWIMDICVKKGRRMNNVDLLLWRPTHLLPIDKGIVSIEGSASMLHEWNYFFLELLKYTMAYLCYCVLQLMDHGCETMSRKLSFIVVLGVSFWEFNSTKWKRENLFNHALKPFEIWASTYRVLLGELYLGVLTQM